MRLFGDECASGHKVSHATKVGNELLACQLPLNNSCYVQVPVSMPSTVLVHCFSAQQEVDMGLLSVVLLLGQHTVSKFLSLDLISCAAYINIACTHSSRSLNQ